MRHLELPENTPDYMRPAYEGCIAWAAKNHHIRQSFLEEMGWSKEWSTEETGFAFVKWVNKNIWGDPFQAEEGDSE